MSDRKVTPAPKAYRANVFWDRQDCATLSAQVYLASDADSFIGALLAERDQLRAERDSHQRLCIAEMEKNSQLRAEVAMLRSYEAEWERTLNQLRAELEAIRGQEPVAWVSPDAVGGTRWKAGALQQLNDGSPLYSLPPQQPDAVSVPGVHEFAVEILRGALEGGDFDGGDIQEMGVRHGLLFPEHRTERCGEHCECAEYGFPVECFRIARALLATKTDGVV
ncbi:hypothetical protein GO594_28070 [Pseudomonas otitidis]|uniref:Uncharacterized protein n=1 Tax=Metapseudomonas otitidis TaxID=319939 RepID=A0A7X3HD84_9GAMM|nr:hypothetical protein [Pseudomonas otitidis]MWK59858.1 hypothetical protein [Pseudomonas otitidis]